MPWFRVGDTLATDPRVVVLQDAKDPMVFPACVGFLTMLGTLSTQHGTDWVIHPGFLQIAGGPAAADLLKRCIRAELITFLGGKGTARRWKLKPDAPELWHLRPQAQVDWDRRQKLDTRNPAFQLAVLLRDGDSCRYCGRAVQPYDTKSARGRSIDHISPLQLGATGPDDLVVSCLGCNGRRGKDWQDETQRATFGDRWKLLPPPAQLFFVRRTVDWIEDQGRTIPADAIIVNKAPRADDTTAAPTTQTFGPASQHPAAAGVAAPTRRTTAPADQHPAQAGVAATGARTTPTRPRSQRGAASTPAADQHPASPAGVAATADSTTAPECTQHPAPAGVADAPESRTDPSPTDRSRGAPPGRVGTGRVGTGGSSSPAPSPSLAPSPDPPQSPARPRPTRRGRRRPRTSPSPDQHQ